MNKHNITITIDIDDILNYVYAQSAWYNAHKPGARVLTADNRNMLLIKLREGYADLRQRVMGYLYFDNYNPNTTSANITMTFTFKHEQGPLFETALRDTIVALLAQFMLMRFYGELDPHTNDHSPSIYHLEWRRYKAKLLLAFAHDEL